MKLFHLLKKIWFWRIEVKNENEEYDTFVVPTTCKYKRNFTINGFWLCESQGFQESAAVSVVMARQTVLLIDGSIWRHRQS